MHSWSIADTLNGRTHRAKEIAEARLDLQTALELAAQQRKTDLQVLIEERLRQPDIVEEETVLKSNRDSTVNQATSKRRNKNLGVMVKGMSPSENA